MKRSLKFGDFEAELALPGGLKHVVSSRPGQLAEGRISVGDNVRYGGRVWRVAYVSEVRDLIILEV